MKVVVLLIATAFAFGISGSFSNAPLFIYNAQDFAISMKGRMESVGDVGAPDLKASIQNYAALGRVYGSGANIDGWIVVGEWNGQVFQSRASRQGLLDLATGKSQNGETLSSMVAVYQDALK